MNKKVLFALAALMMAMLACAPLQAAGAGIEAGLQRFEAVYHQIKLENLFDDFNEGLKEFGYEFPASDLSEEQDTSAEESAPIEREAEESAAPACPLTDKGVQIHFASNPGSDGFYNLSNQMAALRRYQGCNFLVEGRVDTSKEEHHIWVFDGRWSLKVCEGSLWVYPKDWNMADFSTEKPPIMAEFVTAKRRNQHDNAYDWVIVGHDGNKKYEFPAGQATPKVNLPDNGNFSTPRLISVHGIWGDGSFSASIGAEDTYTVAKIDGDVVYWYNAKDNVEYSSIEAYTMPSSYDLDDVKKEGRNKFGSTPTLLK